MTVERIELMPDVWLTAVRTGKFKSSYWAVQLLSPMREDTAALNAALPYVLRRGTGRLPDMTRLSAALDELYGGVIEPMVRKSGDMQCIGFLASFLDDACVPGRSTVLEQVAELLGELLLHPATKNGRLRQDYVLSERDNLIRLIRSQENDKRQYAQDRLIQEMYAGEAYAVGRFGTVERAEKITVARMFGQYQTLLEAAPIELYYCGSAPAERVELAWREALMGLPRSSRRYAVETNCRRPLGAPVREFREQMDMQQGIMELGFRYGFGLSDPAYPAMMVANAMFGGTTNSRLFLHVREKRSLCYYASSTLLSLKGAILVSCGVEPSRFDEAREEILAQLEEIKQGRFTTEELEAAKRSVLNSLRSALDEQGRMCAYWQRDRAAGEAFELERLIRHVSGVTEGQAAAAAMEAQLDSIYYLSGGTAEEGARADETV